VRSSVAVPQIGHVGCSTPLVLVSDLIIGGLLEFHDRSFGVFADLALKGAQVVVIVEDG
jgi:hypothetical protein